MAGAGFEVPATRRICDQIWMKLIGNLAYNPVAALTLARMDEINFNPGLLDIIRVVIQECGESPGHDRGVLFRIRVFRDLNHGARDRRPAQWACTSSW